MAEKYVTTEDTIVGDELFLFVDEGGTKSPLAFGTSCGIDLSADTIDASSKMSGPWKESLVGQLGYTVSCDFLISLKDGHMSFKTLKAKMASREPIPFVMSKHSKTELTGEYTSTGGFVKGSAIITALSVKADNGALCTSSISLQGTGSLDDDPAA
nr:phage tail tube protein [uncultured Macellibacteroides sp.]